MNKKDENLLLNDEEINDLAAKINKIIDKKISIKNNWWKRLLDKNDTSVSSSSFYLISVTIIGLLLLLVPMIVLIIEIVFNHTIQTDLNGMAAYIGSVAGLFASGGIVKGWISYNDSKRLNKKIKNAEEQDEIE